MAVTRTSEGLVARDDFPVDGSLSSPWQVLTSAAVSSGRLRAPSSGSSGSRPGARYNLSASASTELFTQALGRFSDASGTNGLQFAHITTTQRTGYGLHADTPDTGLNRWDNNTPVGLDTAATISRSANTNYGLQLYTGPAIQEGWAEGNSGTRTVSDVDNTYESTPRVPAMWRNNNLVDSDHAAYDEFIWMTSKNLVVNGPLTDWSIRIIGTGEVLIGEIAADSGGIATIDCSMFGGQVEEMVPYDGWIRVEIVEDSEVVDWFSGAIYPGDEYTWDGVADGGTDGSGGGLAPGDPEEPEQDPARPRNLDTSGVLLDIDPLDFLSTEFMRTGEAWYYSSNMFEKVRWNQRRFDLNSLPFMNFIRWPTGILLEPTSEQKITEPFDLSSSDWFPDSGLTVETCRTIFKDRTGAILGNRLTNPGTESTGIRSNGVALSGNFTALPETATAIVRQGTAAAIDIGVWSDSGSPGFVYLARVDMETGDISTISGEGSCFAYLLTDKNVEGKKVWWIRLVVTGPSGFDKSLVFMPSTEEAEAGYTDVFYLGWEENGYGSFPLSGSHIAGDTFWHTDSPDPRESCWLFHGVLWGPPGVASWIWRVGGDDGGIGLRITAAGEIEAVHSRFSGDEVTSTIEADWVPGDEISALVTLYSTGRVLLTLSLRGEEAEDAGVSSLPASSPGLGTEWQSPEGVYFDVSMPVTLIRMVVVKLEAMLNLPGFSETADLALWEMQRLEKRLGMMATVI